MPNPWQQIDELAARHRDDLLRARTAVREAKATGFKVLDTGIWRCRFRPYRAEHPVDVRGRSAGELAEQLGALVRQRAEAKETARKAREEERRAHRELVAKTRAEVKKLGASRFKVRHIGDPPDRALRWGCLIRSKRGGVLTAFEEASAEALIAAVRRVANQGRGHA